MELSKVGIHANEAVMAYSSESMAVGIGILITSREIKYILYVRILNIYIYTYVRANTSLSGKGVTHMKRDETRMNSVVLD